MTRCFSAWDADTFPGLFRPWADGGIRCDSSKTDEVTVPTCNNTSFMFIGLNCVNSLH